MPLITGRCCEVVIGLVTPRSQNVKHLNIRSPLEKVNENNIRPYEAAQSMIIERIMDSCK